MGCQQYSPLVSRFLDDDLERAELDGFLEHLFACEACRRELQAFESLRAGFRTADAMDAPPEARRVFSLQDLAARSTVRTGAVPLSGPALQGAASPAPYARKPGRRAGTERSFSVWRFVFPQNFLRYAVPMIALIVVGIWVYPEGPSERIDVRAIPPSGALADQLSRQDADSENMHLYVMDHATPQPWAHYGSHLPMIQRVAGSYP